MRDSYIRYLEQLEGDYKETFDLINVYVGTQRLDEDTQEEKMSELLDIFIAAQKSGKPVEKIVGTDVKQFCRNFCEGDGFKSRLLHIADFFRTISIFVLIYCGFEFIVLDVSNGKICNLWTYSGQLNMTGYLLGSILVLLVGFVVDVVLRQLLFCYVKIANKMRNIIVILVMIASFPVMMYFMDIDDNVLWNCPLWILFVISGIYIFAYHFFNRTRLKNRRFGEVKFWTAVKEDALKDISKEMEKKYYKKKAHYAKKGKPELTEEEFLNIEERRCVNILKMKWFYYVFPIIFAAIQTVFICLGEGVAHALNCILGNWESFVVMWLVMIGIWTIEKQRAEEQRQWIAKEREKFETLNRNL